MNIALVSPVMVPIPPPKYGGIELIVDELAQGLAHRGHQVTVFCAGGSTLSGNNITVVESSPYPLFENPGENREWEERQLLSVLKRQHEFDIIHLHYEPAVCCFDRDGETIDIARRFSVPTVFTFHNTTSIPVYEAYYRQYTDVKNQHFVFISKNQLKPLAFLPNATVIYNGLPIQQFPLGKEKEDVLFFLGRITPAKGILDAITVSELSNIPLNIAARIDDIDREFYDRDVKHRIDGNHIRYIGEIGFSEKVEYLRKARCLLFPIQWEEPFGLVMVEALACGTPVVAFRRGSVPEIIQNGVNGFVINTVEEMVEAVKNVDTLSPRVCRASAEDRFDVGRMVDEYERFFLAIAQKK